MEFRAIVYRDAYFLPTIGIAFIGVMGAGFLASVVGIFVGNDLSNETGYRITATWIVSAGIFAAAWWVRRQWRIHHERKLILDQDGITYVPFEGRSRVMRWHEIEAITERKGFRRGSGYFLRVRLSSGHFVIGSTTFDGYGEIRARVYASAPGRVTLMPH